MAGRAAGTVRVPSGYPWRHGPRGPNGLRLRRERHEAKARGAGVRHLLDAVMTEAPSVLAIYPTATHGITVHRKPRIRYRFRQKAVGFPHWMKPARESSGGSPIPPIRRAKRPISYAATVPCPEGAGRRLPGPGGLDGLPAKSTARIFLPRHAARAVPAAGNRPWPRWRAFRPVSSPMRSGQRRWRRASRCDRAPDVVHVRRIQQRPRTRRARWRHHWPPRTCRAGRAFR